MSLPMVIQAVLSILRGQKKKKYMKLGEESHSEERGYWWKINEGKFDQNILYALWNSPSISCERVGVEGGWPRVDWGWGKG